MYTSPKVNANDLPSLGDLRRATFGAVVLAAVIVTTVVLPAERGVDPTGVGDLLGLTAMGMLKTADVSSTAAATPAVADVPVEHGTYLFRTDELSLTLQPGQGSEIKAIMRKGDQMVYSWTADRGELFFDFHGEPKGAPSDVFTSFEKGTKSIAEGEFEAPFEGVHGWYWKNKTAKPIAILLKTSGVYESISRK
jgi:hypothetical protein